MNKSVVESILAQKLIVIVRGVQKEKLIPLAQAMYDGGVRLLEITFDNRFPESYQETAASIAELSAFFDGRMYIGAGTVLNTAQVKLTADAGGKFIISPNVSFEVVRQTKTLGMVSIPGALTPSEIVTAYEYGADFVKLFPATGLGPEYIKATRAPLSHIPMLAVGGIDLENILQYLKAGVSGFGIGSNITDKDLISKNDWAGITRLASMHTGKLRGEK